MVALQLLPNFAAQQYQPAMNAISFQNGFNQTPRHAIQVAGMVCPIAGGLPRQNISSFPSPFPSPSPSPSPSPPPSRQVSCSFPSPFPSPSPSPPPSRQVSSSVGAGGNISSSVGQNYTVVKDLGQGSFSRVQLLRDRRSGEARVLKITEAGMGTDEAQMCKNEFQVLKALDHPNIVKCFEYFEDIARGQLLMVLEYVGGGDCQQLLRSPAKPQNEALIAKLISQVLSVLSYCHARGIMHCDIKPENMMLAPPSSGQGMPDCKVIDFGLTHRVNQQSYDFIGTPSYMAPEIVTGISAFTIKADIWPVGVTACELLASMAPFGSPKDHGGDAEPVLQRIRNFARFQDIESRLCRSQSWMSCSSSAKDFVKTLLIVDPAHRPHADQALKHAWFIQNKASIRTGLGGS